MEDGDLISAPALSSVIGAIYDCALEPEHWLATMKLIAAVCHSPMGTLGIIDARDGSFRGVYDHGTSDAFVELYPKYSGLNPLFPAAYLREVGEVNTQSMLLDMEEFYESRFFLEFLKPHGMGDIITCLGLKSSTGVALLTATRRLEEPGFGEREVRLLRLLSPHVCRALKISDALDLRALTSEMLTGTLDTLAAGVFVLDAKGRVVHKNRAAERQLRTSRAFRLDHGVLVLRHPEPRAALANALAEIAGVEDHSNDFGLTIALANGAEPGFVASVLPINRGQRRGVFAPYAAAAALFVQDPTMAPLMPGEAFARLHGLTAGELRVLLAMAPGLGPNEAADILGIAESTARTHLQRIFAKTGTNRQAELIRLLMASAPPTGGH